MNKQVLACRNCKRLHTEVRMYSACTSGLKVVVDLNSSVSSLSHFETPVMSQRPWGLVVRDGKLLLSCRQDPVVGAQLSKSHPCSIKVSFVPKCLCPLFSSISPSPNPLSLCSLFLNVMFSNFSLSHNKACNCSL